MMKKMQGRRESMAQAEFDKKKLVVREGLVEQEDGRRRNHW